LRDEYTRTSARALAAEALTLERTLSGLVNRAYGLTQAEIGLMRQTAPPRTPIPVPGFPGPESHACPAGKPLRGLVI